MGFETRHPLRPKGGLERWVSYGYLKAAGGTNAENRMLNA